MSERQIERAAYIAAHRILEADMSAPELVCDGAIRTHAVDTIAHIICEAIDFESRAIGAMVTGSGAAGFAKYHTRATVIEMPSHVSS